VITGYLSSAFDLFNVADLDLIAQARERCQRLIVGVHSDAYVERTTGRPPVVPQDERMALISHVRGVDVVVVDQGIAEGRPATDRPVFTVLTGDLDHGTSEVYWLVPARQTASAAVRAALAPRAAESGVA
jgi:cytidyltransferase-like protein